MRLIISLCLICGILSCSDRQIKHHIEITIFKLNAKVATLSVPEGGGKDFSIINEQAIVIVNFPAPQGTNDNKFIYKDCSVEILEKSGETIIDNKSVSSFMFGGENKPIGGFGKYQIFVSFR